MRILEDDLQVAADREPLGRASARPCRCPSTTIVPACGLTRFRISMIVVVLPQPDSPTRPSVSPSRMSKLMPSTACTVPTRRRSTPLLQQRIMFDEIAHVEHRRCACPATPRRPPAGCGCAGNMSVLVSLPLFDFVAAVTRGAVRRIVSLNRQQRRLDLDALLDAHRAARRERTARTAGARATAGCLRSA